MMGRDLTQDVSLHQALRREKTQSTIALGVAFVLGLAFSIWFAVLNRAAFGADYTQFYSGSRVAGTGHLYDREALRKAGAVGGLSSRLPVVIYGHKILSGLPYRVAQLIWLASGIAALAFFAAFWPGASRVFMMIALAWSMPATLGLVHGQDIAFWLMFFAAGLLLLERKRPWAAGVAFALCICKFHLALGIPIMLAAQKRWKTMIAGAGVVSALIASCFLIEGREWPLRYLEMSQMKGFPSVPVRMPDLYGLAAWLPWKTATVIICSCALVVLLWIAFRGVNDLGMAGAVAAAGGLVLSPHGLAYDCALLIPLAVLTVQRPDMPPWLKVWAVLLISPTPILLLASQKPLLGQILIVAFVVAAAVVVRAQPKRALAG